MSISPPLALIALMLAGAICWPSAAQAQVNRCRLPGGVTLYTDRDCESLGAVPALPRDDSTRGSRGRIHRAGCARNLQDLMYEMTTAIDSGDVNRLAGVYHWAGMSGRAGYAVMGRLEAVVRRPLVDIVPVMPGRADGEDGWLYPQTTVATLPVALRVEQTLANGSTPSRTVFGMQRHFGCLWIKGG